MLAPEPPQRGLETLADVGFVIAHRPRRAVDDAAFGGEVDVAATPLADDAFRHTHAVDVGRVEMADPGIRRRVQAGQRGRFVRRAEDAAEAHRAKADGADAAVAEPSLLHLRLLFRAAAGKRARSFPSREAARTGPGFLPNRCSRSGAIRPASALRRRQSAFRRPRSDRPLPERLDPCPAAFMPARGRRTSAAPAGVRERCWTRQAARRSAP